MKHSQAAQWIRDALWATQKARSDLMEMAGEDKVMSAIQADLMPWVMDENRMMRPLLMMVERLDNGGQFTAQELFNMMYVIETWARPVQMRQLLRDGHEPFPRPDIRWHMGWEAE